MPFGYRRPRQRRIDPTLTLSNAVINDTTSAWIGYQTNIYMLNAFTVQNTKTLPSVSNPPNGDWTVTGVVNNGVVQDNSSPFNGQNEWTISLREGTEVGVGDELDFSYAISFSGSTSYSFTQEMIPVAVPGPSVIGLLGCGLAGALIFRRRSAS